MPVMTRRFARARAARHQQQLTAVPPSRMASRWLRRMADLAFFLDACQAVFSRRARRLDARPRHLRRGARRRTAPPRRTPADSRPPVPRSRCDTIRPCSTKARQCRAPRSPLSRLRSAAVAGGKLLLRKKRMPVGRDYSDSSNRMPASTRRSSSASTSSSSAKASTAAKSAPKYGSVSR